MKSKYMLGVSCKVNNLSWKKKLFDIQYQQMPVFTVLKVL